MKRPRLSDDHPDRQLECEEMLEARLTALMDRSREVGWHQEEVAAAVIELAYNYVLRLNANDETDRQIADAIRSARYRTN
jgi:hypothetical protein